LTSIMCCCAPPPSSFLSFAGLFFIFCCIIHALTLLCSCTGRCRLLSRRPGKSNTVPIHCFSRHIPFSPCNPLFLRDMSSLDAFQLLNAQTKKPCADSLALYTFLFSDLDYVSLIQISPYPKPS
jgi:hypothetical protein